MAGCNGHVLCGGGHGGGALCDGRALQHVKNHDGGYSAACGVSPVVGASPRLPPLSSVFNGSV